MLRKRLPQPHILLPKRPDGYTSQFPPISRFICPVNKAIHILIIQNRKTICISEEETGYPDIDVFRYNLYFIVITARNILKKIWRKGYELSLPSIKENIRDIAGVRIICSFISDIYRLSDMLKNHRDITVVEIKDYIKNPKPNGYKSLHMILQIPISMSDRVDNVYVELQIRTIAMDFWASLEHKIYYKYDKAVPVKLMEDLKEAAQSVSQLDEKMEAIHNEMKRFKARENEENGLNELVISDIGFNIPKAFLTQLLNFEE
ncbi:MAG: GTP pyrophosphokinase YwaC [Thermocaproicibacter melissae]